MAISASDSQLLLEALEALVVDVIEPQASQIDATDEFPWAVYRAMAEMGLFALGIPEKYAGLDADMRTILLVTERLARASASCAVMVGNCLDGAAPLVLAGDEAQQSAWLPKIASGDAIPCFALTEPHAGSDASAIATRARQVDGGYEITGSKAFCTNGAVGDLFTVFARTSQERNGISAFVIPREAKGLQIGRSEKLIGLRGSPTTELSFNAVAVGSDARLGEEGDGLALAFGALDEARLNAAAIALGIGRAAFEHATAYAREREQFGKPIIKHQGVAFMLADMATELTAGWSLLKHAATILEDTDDRRAARLHCAMAKLFCTDIVMRVTVDAVQVHGGYGLSNKYPVERLLRDAKAFQIFDGTNQIQRMLIGRGLEEGTSISWGW